MLYIRQEIQIHAAFEDLPEGIHTHAHHLKSTVSEIQHFPFLGMAEDQPVSEGMVVKPFLATL